MIGSGGVRIAAAAKVMTMAYLRFRRSPSAVTAAEQAIEKPLAVLDAELASRACLLGDDFSVADLNVASVLSMAGFVGLDVSGFKNVKRWLDACLGRPAFARAQKAGS